MQATFPSDDMITAMLLGLALVLPFVCTFARWKPIVWLGYGLWVMWLSVAIWQVLSFINIRWVDDSRTTYHHNAIFKAIQEGRSIIPLPETTNFSWSAVCIIMPYQYLDDSEEAIIKEVLQSDYVPILWSESDMYIFATPNGTQDWNMAWGRFTPWFLRERQGHEYAKRLNNQPYLIKRQTQARKDNPWQNLCYRPDEVSLTIAPWPDK
jgi:hypothetical protein